VKKRQQHTHELNTILSQTVLERRLVATEITCPELETFLHERTIMFAEREPEEMEEKTHLSKEREEEKVSDKSCCLKVDQDIRSLFVAAITFEDHADLQDKYESISHTASQKLAALAVELTAHERQVESPLTLYR
jgi:hypothetical protein